MRKGSKKPEDEDELMKRLSGMTEAELRAEVKERMPGSQVPIEVAEKFFKDDTKGSLRRAATLLDEDKIIYAYSNAMLAGIQTIFMSDPTMKDPLNNKKTMLYVALLLEAYGEEPQ